MGVVKTTARSSRRPPRRADATCVRADAALVRAFDLLGKRWTGVVLGTLSRALLPALEQITSWAEHHLPR